MTDASAGSQTVTGGGGLTTVWGGTGDSITGGAGNLQVNDLKLRSGRSMKITGGAGNLVVVQPRLEERHGHRQHAADLPLSATVTPAAAATRSAAAPRVFPGLSLGSRSPQAR